LQSAFNKGTIGKASSAGGKPHHQNQTSSCNISARPWFTKPLWRSSDGPSKGSRTLRSFRVLAEPSPVRSLCRKFAAARLVATGTEGQSSVELAGACFSAGRHVGGFYNTALPQEAFDLWYEPVKLRERILALCPGPDDAIWAQLAPHQMIEIEPTVGGKSADAMRLTCSRDNRFKPPFPGHRPPA
jgi:hypothetical protein